MAAFLLGMLGLQVVVAGLVLAGAVAELRAGPRVARGDPQPRHRTAH